MCAVGIDRGRIAQLCEAAIEALVAVPVIFSSQLSPSNAVARFAAWRRWRWSGDVLGET